MTRQDGEERAGASPRLGDGGGGGEGRRARIAYWLSLYGSLGAMLALLYGALTRGLDLSPSASGVLVGGVAVLLLAAMLPATLAGARRGDAHPERARVAVRGQGLARRGLPSAVLLLLALGALLSELWGLAVVLSAAVVLVLRGRPG